jgi:hypothetical protein
MCKVLLGASDSHANAMRKRMKEFHICLLFHASKLSAAQFLPLESLHALALLELL